MIKLQSAKHYSLGVDPGVSGGICLLSPQRDIVVLCNTPESCQGCCSYIESILSQCTVKACMEKVSGYIGKVDPGGRMFVFGQSYGRWEGILTSLGLWPFENPTPQLWQKTLGITPRIKKGDSKETSYQFKSRLLAKARALYPDEKRITRNTCDALLIAHFCSLL